MVLAWWKGERELLIARIALQPRADLALARALQIELGEGSLEAAGRELQEETGVKVGVSASWGANDAFTTTDAIYPSGVGTDFHYVISHYFAECGAGQEAEAKDDATDVRWFTREECESEKSGIVGDVASVVRKVEEMRRSGMLQT